MGGLVCSTCNPPRTDADCVLRLVISGGMWDDAENPFDFQGGGLSESRVEEEGHGPRAATSPTPKNADIKSATNFDEATTSELATPRDESANKPTSRRVGEPLLDLEFDFYFNLPTSSDGRWLGPEVISSRLIGEESKKESKRTGLLDLSVQKSGFVDGSHPPRNRSLVDQDKTQFAVGQVVRLLRRLDTFRGIVHPRGGYLISSSGRDSEGCPLVALSLGGVVVVSGLVPDAETIQPEEAVSIDDLIG
jgi:hypothetical protein